MTYPSTTQVNLGSAASPQQTSANGGPNDTKDSGLDKPGDLEKTMLDFVQSNYQKIKNARTATERQWYINLAFYFGRQNIVSVSVPGTTTGYRLIVPNAPPWRVRLVINKIRPIVRKEIATLFSNKPRFDVIPATTEDEELAAARAGEQVFDWIYDKKQVQEKLKQAGWWACIAGTGFIKTWWDPKSVDETNNRLGDICIEAVTPFHIFVPDFKCIDIEDQPYVIHATTMSPQFVANKFKITVQPDALVTDSILDPNYLNIQGVNNSANKEVLILEAWFKPGAHKALPNGGLVTIVGGKVAQIQRTWPYKSSKYPFAKIENIPSGKFYAHAMLDDLIPVQKEYNRSRSQIVENKNLMGKPRLLAQKGAVDASKITTEPGQVVFYQPGFQPPVPMQMPELPGYVLEHLQQLEADFREISGQAQDNPSVTSATAMSFQQEKNDTLLADTTDSVEAATAKIGQLVLSYVGQYWDTKRVVKVVGSNSEFDAVVLLGEDLKGNTDLRVETGSALPTSKAAKQAFIMDLIKIGVIPPQQGLEMMEIGGIEKVYDEYLADKRHAERENMRMQGGQAVLCNEWDNHASHIMVHNRFRKSQTYEGLGDQAKINFQNHVLMHQSALAHQQQGDPTGTGEQEPPAPNDQGQLPSSGGSPELPPGPPGPTDIPNPSGPPPDSVTVGAPS